MTEIVENLVKRFFLVQSLSFMIFALELLMDLDNSPQTYDSTVCTQSKGFMAMNFVVLLTRNPFEFVAVLVELRDVTITERLLQFRESILGFVIQV